MHSHLAIPVWIDSWIAFVKAHKNHTTTNYLLELFARQLILIRRLKSCDYFQERSITHHDRCNEPIGIPIQVNNEAVHPETIKWTVEKDKYEIHQTILEKVEISDILTHCLWVVHKIKIEVGSNEKKLVQSYMQVLPCTFSIPLTAMWDQVAEEFPMDEEMLDNFNILLRHFFEAHSTDDDCHGLLTQICNTCLPKQMKSQSFFYQLRELNDYVDWLPGHEPKLTEDQLNLAFYTGMRLKWKERYINAGKSTQHDNRQSLLRYF
jgi:hypothetical protein